ncbi:uncharacterized protein LOC127007955 [Eriocheir sinensis]|uniref:uncharacterized protein LOC127007955 n=1 Tax=Eriocheir sinensis TaxID=95602 RepID=UPI0021C99254|nr:uncharacterized protein LOC127007955 [Eriocheir sinensis]
MRLLAPAVVVALVALAAADDAEPVCAKTCSASDDGSGFQPWHQYVFVYRGEASTSTSTSTGEHQQHQSTLSVAARVVVTAGASPCDLRMQIPSLEMQGDSWWLTQAVQAHDLYFSYQGGRVEELCPHEEEVPAATNFKRSVLSLLHTSMNLDNPKDKLIVQESDIAGECRTEYHLMIRGEDNLVFNKTKNDCLAQHSQLPHLPHSPAPFTLPLAAPFFRSNQECLMESQRGVWKSVECQQHVKVDGPLAPSEGPISFTLSSSLVLETSRPERSAHASHQEQWARRESLRMSLEEREEAEEEGVRQPHESSHTQTQAADALRALARMEEKEERPRVFGHLVERMSRLDQQGVQELWDTFSEMENHKDFMLDGFLACDSGPCVGLVTRLASLEPATLPPATLSSWLAAMHLQSQADPSSITHIMSLVESHLGVREAAVMAASSVVFRACQKNSSACHTHAQPFLKHIRQEVGEGCEWGQDKQQQQRVKFALQALGNAGVVPKDNFPQRCYKNKLLPTELRVAALQTLRRVGCQDSEAPWTVLEDGQDSVEVRLAAYLALQPCAAVAPRFFLRLQTLLEKEEVNQVGSFIWTHVRNLADQPGASQGEQEVARLAAQLTLDNKFNTNGFQASKNYRLAQFSDTLGVGGIVDGDVIFTPESYLPRAAAVNLTLQLLGKSVNLFEIGGNFKGLEDYVERFFGKGSYFENEEIQKLLQNLRPKRDARDEKLEEYQALYDKAKERKEAVEGGEEPAAALYLRVFGDELMRSDNILTADPLKAIQEAVQRLSSHKNFQVMSQEFVTPTLLGFPLRLKYNMSGSLSLSKEGRFDMAGPGQLLLEGRLSPSVTVAADETFLLDGYGSYSGIKRSTTHHTHTHLGGKISIRGGHLVDIQLDLPETEVMKIHSSVKVTVYSNADQGWSEPATQTPPQTSEGCSSKALSDAIGLQVCSRETQATQLTMGTLADANLYERQIVVTKSDNFDKFVFSFRNTASNMEAVFDTPGSSVDRRVSVVLDSRADGVGGTVEVPGRQVEGQYRWSSTLKRLALKYYKDSQPHAEFDASLQSEREGPGMRHTSLLVVALPGLWEVKANGSLLQAPESLSWDATFMSSFQDDPLATQGKWEVMEEQHQASARVMMGQYFGSASGSVLCEAELTVVEAKCEYGLDGAQTDSLALSARLTEKMVNGEKSLEGRVSVQSSQADAGLTVDVLHQPGNTAANASLSLSGAKINSTLVSRNIGEGDKRDVEMAFSVFSQQLALDYLGRVLYKASDGALQAEAEARLGSLGHMKLSLSHLLQCQPFHALAGIHLELNDHLLQASYNVDLSKPGHKEIMVHSAVGAASAGFYAEVDHARTKPFQMHAKVFGGRDGQQVGAALHSTSDAQWEAFSGSAELTWFDWSSEVRHEALWSDGLQELNLFSGQKSFNIAHRVAGKVQEESLESYGAMVKDGAEVLFHIRGALLKDQQHSPLGNYTFNGDLILLRSELSVSGTLNQSNTQQVKAEAEVRLTLPDARTSEVLLTLSHAFDGAIREVNVSSTSSGLTYEGQFRLVRRHGWFSNDSLSLSVNVSTPVTHLRSAALLLETHTDPSLVDFVELEVEDFKIRGEAQIGDPTNLFDVKLQYEARGSVCESHAHLYHKFVDGKYLTGATLSPTQTHDPWDLRVVTLLGDTLGRKSMEVEFAAPVWSPPFHLRANYSRSGSHFDLQLQGGMERQASLTLLGKNDQQGDTQVLAATLELLSPWTSPVFVNVSHQCGQRGLNTTLDLQTSWQPLNNVKADFSVTYVNSSCVESHFQLTHEHLKVQMDLTHRFTKSGLSSQLEFSANAARATGKIVCTWDENFVPQSATAHLALLNMLSEPLDLNASFIKGISDYHTQVLGSLGDSLLRVDHQLRVSRLMDWVSTLSVVLPNRQDVLESEATVKVVPDLTSMMVKFFIRSPWTEEINMDLSSQRVDALRETKLAMSYGESSLGELMLQTPEPLHWHQADVSLSVSSSHFTALDVQWKHRFGEETLAVLEIFVDDEFYLKGEQKLVLSRNKLTQRFEEFQLALTLNIPSNSFDFETKLAFQSDFRGEFQVESGDLLVHVTSFPETGEIFTLVSQGPVQEWKATLVYGSDSPSLPNLILAVEKDDSNIFTIESKFTEVFPKLDGSLTMEVSGHSGGPSKRGHLQVTADMSRIQDYDFKGTAKLESNFEGFEKFSVELNTDVNMEGGTLEGKLSGALGFNEWHYKTDLFGSLELTHNRSLVYRSKYTLMHRQQVLDKKEVDLVFQADKMEAFLGNITFIPGPQAPQWGLFLSYNGRTKELQAHVIPGNARKYQVMARLDASMFRVDSQIVSEDGQPPFKVIAGDVSWTLRRRRRLIKLDLSSDFNLIKTVKGVIGIQRRRRLGVGAKIMVNENEISGNVTYTPSGPRIPGRVSVELKNEVLVPFKTNVNLRYSLSPGSAETNLAIDLNDKKDWLIVDAKGSLPESYITLKLPYKDFENVTVSLKVSTSPSWGVVASVIMPKLCINIEGTLDPELKFASLSTKVLEGCDRELFDFELCYRFDRDFFNLTSLCRLQNYGLLYEVAAEGKMEEFLDGNLKVKTQIYNIFSLGFECLSAYDEDDGWSVTIQAQNDTSKWTHFLYNHRITASQSDINTKVNERALLSLKAHYDVHSDRFDVNGTVSHTMFYLPFSATATASGKIEERQGRMNLGLSTSSPIFSQGDLLVTFEAAENIEGTFKLSSSFGNAEATVVLKEASELTSITFDMSSSLHTFQEYHIELTHRVEGSSHHISAVSKQDGVELELRGSLLDKAEGFQALVSLRTPFRPLETLNMTLEYPRPDSPQGPYTFDMHGLVNGYSYGVTCDHQHDNSWHRQKTGVVIVTPGEGFGNFSLSAEYDVSSHVSVLLGTSEGDMSLKANWENLKTHFILSINIDLSQFGLGKYDLHYELAHSSQRTETLRLEYSQAPISWAPGNYTAQLTRGRNMNFMEVRVDIDDPGWAVNKTAYSFGYDLYAKKNLLKLQGQYQDMTVSAVIMPKNIMSPLSGSFKVQTNIEKYKAVTGSWNLARRSEAFLTKAKLDINEQTVMSFSGQLNPRPQGASAPWQELELDVLFESSLTLSHHWHAEYEVSTWSLSSTYKHGLDHFHLKLLPRLRPRVGTLLLTGNLPIRGVSEFGLDLSYKLKEVYTASLTASLEDTHLMTSVELEPRKSWSSFKASLTSPYLRPVRASLLWTFKEQPWLVESTVAYGKMRGELKINANPYGTLKHLELEINLPFECFHKALLTAKYSTSQAGQGQASAGFAVNNHTANVEAKIKYNNNFKVEISGWENIFGTEGALDLRYEGVGSRHTGNASATWAGQKLFTVSFTGDPQGIQLDMKKGELTCLSAKVTWSQVDIQFMWNSETFFNMSGSLTPLNDNYNLELTIKSSETQPVSLQASASTRGSQEGRAFLRVGEREYNVSVRGDIAKLESSLEFHLQSSDSPYTPLDFKAKYNLRDYLRGRMSSLMELGSVSLEWGGKLQLVVKGMQSRGQSKMKFEVVTPFRSLPKLYFGYDSQYSLARSSVDVMCTVYVEWSQKITFTGYFKHINRNLDLFIGLTSSYSSLEMFDISLKSSDNRIEVQTTVNKDKWNVTCDYQLVPFSVTLTLNTPLEDYKTLSLAASGSLRRGHLSAEAEFTWTNTIKVQIEAELWDLEVKLYTPWKPVQEAFLKTSLRTESEALMWMASTGWGQSSITLKTTYTPQQLKIVAEYKKEGTDVGLVMFEFAPLTSRKYKAALQVRTPFVSLKSLGIEFDIKPKSHEYMIDFITSNSEHILQLTANRKQGKLRVHLPMFGKFMWTMEAKDAWLRLDTEASLALGGAAAPMKASLSYLISPDEGHANVSLKSELPHQWLESLSLNITADHDGTSTKAVAALAWKLRYQEPSSLTADLTSGVSKRHLNTLVKLEGNCFEHPVEVTFIFPLFNPLVKEGSVELVLVYGDSLNKLLYKTRNEDNYIALHQLVIDVPWWSCAAELSLKDDTFSGSVSFPHTSDKHALILRWPHTSLEHFNASLELHLPHLPEGGIKFSGSFKALRKFSFLLGLEASYGQKSINTAGSFQYVRKLRQLKCEGEVVSNWVGDHSLEANLQWLRNTKADIKLKTWAQEHNCSLLVDVSDNTLVFNCSSPWLPYGKCSIRGKINTDLSITKIKAEGELEGFMEGEKLSVLVSIDEETLPDVVAKVTVKQGQQKLVSLSSGVTVRKGLPEVWTEVKMNGVYPYLRGRFHLKLEDNENKRSLMVSLMVSSKPYSLHTSLHIESSKDWRKRQIIQLFFQQNEFGVSSEMGQLSGAFQFKTKFSDFELRASSSYSLSTERSFKISVDSSMEALQSLVFAACLPASSSSSSKTELLEVYFRGRGDQEVRLNLHCFPDPVMGWSVWAALSTPFTRLERFELMTPQFGYQSHIFRAFVEFPGQKVGMVLASKYRNRLSPDMQFSLYLPFEKYDIISMKIVRNDLHFKNYAAVEMRVGKMGFTASVADASYRHMNKYELLVGLNEWSVKTCLTVLWMSGKGKLQVDFAPKDLVGIQFFSTQMRYRTDEEFFFDAKTDSQELLKAHWSWGEAKIFSLTTPRVYPGHMAFHLESGPEVQECLLQATLSTAAGGSGRPYGFQVHHRQLAAGHTIAFLGLAPGRQVRLEGTHHMSWRLINESLTLEVDKRQVGYTAFLQQEPGLFSSTHSGGLLLVLPVHSVQLSTRLDSAVRQIDFSSQLKWGRGKASRKPLNLKVQYNDYSILGKGRHHLRAVLSHPDTRDIRLQANLTRSLNSSLHGVAELVDDNSPEMKVVATLQAQPARQDGEQTVSLSLSQPASNLSLLVGAQLRQSATLSEAQCLLQYYSLASEDWQRLNLSASLEAEGGRRVVTVATAAPEGGWGRTWRGAVEGRPEEASVLVEGSSDGPGAAWGLGATVRRRLPELHVYLSLGSQQEVQQQARLRLGLHSPVEAGAALDHFTFGQWHRDSAALGLRLTSPHVLQAFMEFDPSLDYSAEDFVARLASPLHKVTSTWQREAAAAVLGTRQWVQTELPSVSGVLVNRRVLEAVWRSESTSLRSFITEAEEVLSEASGHGSLMWQELLWPRLQQGLRLITAAHAWAEDKLEHVRYNMSWLLQEWMYAAQLRWREASYKLSALRYNLNIWWARTSANMGRQLHATMYWVARTINGARAAVDEWATARMATLRPHWQTITWTMQRYWVQLTNTVTSECWWPVQHAAGELNHSLMQGLGSGWSTLRAFLQPETTLPVLYKGWQHTSAWAHQTLDSMQDTVQQLQDYVHGPTLFGYRQKVYQALNTAWEYSRPPLSDFAQNGVSGLVPHITRAVDRSLAFLGQYVSRMQTHATHGSLYSKINAFTVEAYNKVWVAWQRWKAQSQADTTLANVLREIIKKSLDLNDDIFMKSYVFDPEVEGRVLYNQHLPVAWPSFLQTPHWHNLGWESDVEEAQRLLQEGVEVPASRWGAPWMRGSLLPPFVGTAVISGQHITTFDMDHYQFLGPCSYLLAHDFVGQDFTVVGVYQAEAGVVGLASIQVLTPSKKFVLSVNGSVDATRPHAEVHSAGDVSSLKVGGVLVSCDQVSHSCSITVSGKYFGRLAGLLGNYNHEPSDDRRGPDGQASSSPAQLATWWAMGDKPCYQANQAVEVNVTSPGLDVEECSQLFLKPGSPLSACFYAVNPRPYFSQCLGPPGHSGGEGRAGSLCGAVAAYTTQCLAQGFWLPRPDQCREGREEQSLSKGPVQSGSCEVPGGEPVPSRWAKTFRGETQGSVDLAFVIELANCNKGKNLQQLLQLVKVHMRRAGSEDVRYALLTVQEGSTGHPSAFMGEVEMMALLGTLNLQGPKDDLGGAAAVISAAKRLRWRPGVSRIIVQLSCRPCDAGEVVHQALQENDVSFHLVTKHKVTMAGPNPKKSNAMAKKLLGFDDKLGYTVRDIKKFAGTEKLRTALQEPEGSCVRAAQASGGSVFNMNKWIPSKEVLSKKFLRVLSQRVAVSSTAPECQNCQCVGSSTEMKLQCRKCSDEFSAPMEGSAGVPEPAEGSQAARRNYTIKADIKKDFVHHYLEANAALNGFGSDSANLGDSEEEESMSSEEEEEEEEEEYGEYEDGQNYENYEVEY